MVRRLSVAQTPRGTPVVEQERPTAEEQKRDDLDKAVASRNRTVEDRQFRERAAVGMEAAKRARLGGRGTMESRVAWIGGRHMCGADQAE